MRDLYAKHLNKLYDYANGDFSDVFCHFCSATIKHSGNKTPYSVECELCPLNEPSLTCNWDMRAVNLRDDKGAKTTLYSEATPSSIRKHTRWIEKRVKEKTDCEFYWK